MSYAIEIVNLTKRFPKPKRYRDLLNPFRREEITALIDVNIQVNKGEIFGLLGPNGAGKTTLIKVLCTFLPTSGTAFVNGYNILEAEEQVKASIGLVSSEERSFYWRRQAKSRILCHSSEIKQPDFLGMHVSGEHPVKVPGSLLFLRPFTLPALHLVSRVSFQKQCEKSRTIRGKHQAISLIKPEGSEPIGKLLMLPLGTASK